MSEPLATSSAPSERTVAARRSDRNLWISRSHVRAASVALVLLLVCSFALGYFFGSASDADVAVRGPGLLDEVPGEELVDLLARVETAADRHGEIDRLTFPDSLRGIDADPPVVSLAAEPSAKVAPPVAVQPPIQASVAPSTFSVLVARVSQAPEAEEMRVKLEAAGLRPVQTSEVAGGVEVAYGSFESPDEAEATFADLDSLELSSNPVVVSN